MQLHQRAVLYIVHFVHFDTDIRGAMGRSIAPRMSIRPGINTAIIRQQERRQLRPKGGRTGEASRTKSINIFRAVSPRANIFQQKNPLKERICSLKAVDFGLSRKQLTLLVLMRLHLKLCYLCLIFVTALRFFFFFFFKWGGRGGSP